MSRLLRKHEVIAGYELRPLTDDVPCGWAKPSERPEVTHTARRAITLVLAGGRGSRLRDLTDNSAKPAVYFGGDFRIIDFALSNCVNSGFHRIAVLTQYNSHGLLRHLQRGWSFLRPELNEFIDVLPAQQSINDVSWYEGTADAVRQNIDTLRSHRPEYVLILAGDQVYKMDYAIMLADHVAHRAEVSVSCVEVPRARAQAFGIVDVDFEDRIVGFVEKPIEPPGLPDSPSRSLASMGIYIFNAEVLFDELTCDAGDENSSHDFGRDLIPALVKRRRVFAHRFERSCVRSDSATEPYWRDVGAVDSYWQANLDLTTVTPALNLYDSAWPIFTYQEQLPPAKFVHDVEGRRGMAVNSLVSSGSIVSGAVVRQSLLFWKVRVNSYAYLDQTVVLPECDIGRGAHLHRVVVDRGCRVPDGLNVGLNAQDDARRFYRSEGGITLITRDKLAALT